MKRLAIAFILPAFLLAASLSGCKEKIKITDPTENLIAIGSGVNNGYLIEVFSDDSLMTGYNKLYVRVKNNATEEVLNGFTITFAPMMDMGTMQHAAPVENPGKADADGLYEGAVVFIMPSTAGTWTLGVHAEDAQGNVADIDLIPMVGMPAEARILSFESDIDASKLFVSLCVPRNPEVGLNDFELAVHKKESMMSFPPLDGLTIKIEPEMPSMGHGSPNNVDPVSVGNGHYLGKVNFTMTGYWKVNLTILQGQDTVKSHLAFDITL